MTVEWIDAPGEWYNDPRGIWGEVDSVAPAFATVDGRRCFAFQPAAFVRRAISVGGVTDFVIHAQLRFTTNANSGNAQLFRSLDGAAHHIWLQRNSDGKAAVLHGGGTTLQTTAASVFAVDTWYWVSFAGHIADAGGTWEVKIDGTTVLSGTGDTRNGSSGTATKLQLGNENAGLSGNPSWYARDIIMLVNTTTALARRRVAYIAPNNPGHDTLWTPSAGANWENVDDRDGAPDDSTTYNSETTNGDDDLYHLQPLPSSALTIDAVTDLIRLGKTTNTEQIAQRKLRTHNNEFESSDLGIPLGYEWFVNTTPRETNPDTAAAWTEDEVNRLQVGVLKVA